MGGLEPPTGDIILPTTDEFTSEDALGVPSTSLDDEIVALRAIVEGTARSTGEVFFESLVRHLATTIGVSYAFVAEFAQVPTRVRTLAYWGRGKILENIEFDLHGTPCEDVCARRAVPPSPRGPGEVPKRPGPHRAGNRELPGRAAA